MTVVTQLKPLLKSDPGNTRSRPDGAEQRRRLAVLIEASAAGDRAAFRRLYDLSSRFVFGIIVSIVSESGIAEDVAQEVYVSIWKRADTFDTDKGNPLAWMAAIARNRAIDRLRAERARGFVSYSDEVPDIASGDPPVDLTVEAITVRRALADLRPEFQNVLLLYYFKGYSHSEIAGVLDIPIGTAKSWLRRGLAALKESLE